MKKENPDVNALRDLITAGIRDEYRPKKIKELLSKIEDVNEVDEWGRRPIFYAVKSQSPEILKLLLDAGADVNMEAGEGYQPLLLTTQSDRRGSYYHQEMKKIAELLIEKGSDVNAQDTFGYTTLMMAADLDNSALVDLLLKNEANPNVKTEGGTTALECAFDRLGNGFRICPEENLPIISRLVQAGADVNVSFSWQGMTPLMAVLHKNRLEDKSQGSHWEVFNQILAAGADVNAQNEEGRTALMMAVEQNNLEVVDLLLEKGAGANLEDEKERMALHSVTSFDVMKSLIKKGKAYLDIEDESGNTALINVAGLPKAQYPDVEEMVQFLIESRANVFQINNEGYTALMKAAQVGNAFVVNQLNEESCWINYPSTQKEGYHPIHIAAKEGHDNVVKVILSLKDPFDFDINEKDKRGNTPLMLAAAGGHAKVVDTLLEHGASPDVINKDGQDAFTISRNETVKDLIYKKKEELKEAEKAKEARAKAEALLAKKNELLREQNELLRAQNKLLQGQLAQNIRNTEEQSHAAAQIVAALRSQNIELINQDRTLRDAMSPEQRGFVAYDRFLQKGAKAIRDKADKNRR